MKNRFDKAYISGAITGVESEAPALFEAAEKEVLALGFEPVNPIKIQHNHDQTWLSYMRNDIKAMLDCNMVYMLSNWRSSRGANIEHDLAKSLGIAIVYQPNTNFNGTDEDF